jgi:hypothetical protein
MTLIFLDSSETKRRLTKVFAKAGLDFEPSTMCEHQQRFGLDVQCSAFVFNLSKIFSIIICTGLDIK